MDRQGTGNIDSDKIEKRGDLRSGSRRTQLYLALYHYARGEHNDSGSWVSDRSTEANQLD
jgi:hypothetical protein